MQIQIRIQKLAQNAGYTLDLFSASERKLTAVMTSKRTESGKVILGYSGGILI
jgi:hypothetical protein